MNFNLYIIRTLLDDRAMYVGKTTRTIKQRWIQHQSDARRRKFNSHLHRAVRKYGAENFTVDPLVLTGDDIIDEQSLNDAERLMIRLLRINFKLYNLTDGGEGASGRTLSNDARQRIGAARKGKPLTDEHRRRLSDVRRGRKFSDDHRHNISAALQGVPRVTRGSANGRAKLTEEQVGQIKYAMIHGKRGTQRALARKYGVDKSIIYEIMKGLIWKHVPLVMQ